MKYSILQNTKTLRRAIWYSLLADKAVSVITLLFVISMGAATYTQVGLWGLVIYAIVTPLVIIGIYFGVRKLASRIYGDEKGQIVWNYDIQKNFIEVSMGDKAKIKYEKSARHGLRTFEHGVYFKHKRLPFLVLFPDEKKGQIYDLLKENGWLDKVPFRISSILIPMFWLIVFSAAFITSVPELNLLSIPSQIVNPPKKAVVSQDTLDYFLDVAIGNDKKENPYLAIYKWKQPIVYLKTQGNMSDADTACLGKLMTKVNTASNEFELKPSVDNADITIYFAKRSEFRTIESSYESPHFAWLTWKSDGRLVLTEAKVLIDNSEQSETARCTSMNQMLAYSLGLSNTSTKHQDSVFYHEFIEGVTLSELDRELIYLLYGNYGINPGDTKEDIKKKVQVKP